MIEMRQQGLMRRRRQCAKDLNLTVAELPLCSGTRSRPYTGRTDQRRLCGYSMAAKKFF
jgi:hypothetical protein